MILIARLAYILQVIVQGFINGVTGKPMGLNLKKADQPTDKLDYFRRWILPEAGCEGF